MSEAAKKTVKRVYVVRHGEKAKDELTPKGMEQVVASATQHLSGVNIALGWHTGKNRVIQTLELVKEATGQKFNIEHHRDVDPWWALSPTLPQYDVEALEAVLLPRQHTVYDVLKSWPVGWAMMAQMRTAIEHAAIRVSTRSYDEMIDDPCPLIGSHTWVAEMGVNAEQASEAKLMAPADIYRYDVELTWTWDLDTVVTPRIIGYEHLLCPIE